MKKLLLVSFVSLAAACSHSSGDNKPLPTPMSLGTVGTPATIATQATHSTVSVTVPTTSTAAAGRPPQVDVTEIKGEGGGAPGALHPNAKDTLHLVYKAVDPDGHILSTTIQWTKGTTPLGAGETLSPGMFKKGDVISAEITATNATGAKTSRRLTTTIVNCPPEITSVPSGPINGYHPVATDPDGDPVTITMSAVPGFSFDGGTVKMTDPAQAAASKGKVIAITASDPENATTTQQIVINL